MARASIDALSRKMGIDGPETTSEQAAALVDKLGQGLVVFVGRDKAGQVQGEILRALSAPGRLR